MVCGVDLELTVCHWIFVSLLILIILLVIGGYRNFFNGLSRFCKKARGFIEDHRNIFAFGFLLIFFMEQLVLIIVTSQLFNFGISALRFIISVFALIVITTASTQKMFLEIRLKYYEEMCFYLRKAYDVLDKCRKNIK